MGIICTIFCDRCGEDFGDIGEHQADIQSKAFSAGWVEEEEEHVCPGCCDEE